MKMRQRNGDMRAMAVGSDLVDPAQAGRLMSDFDASRLHWTRAWALTVLGAQKGRVPA